MDWHIQTDRGQSGPYPESVVLDWVRSGQLRQADPVWSPGMPSWVPAGQTQPFAAAFAGVPTVAAPAKMGDDPILRAILPVGRSGWAIAAGYLGLFAVLLLPAPFALITGILAVLDIRKNPSKHGMGRAIFGIVMGALFSLLLIALLVIRPH